ncbi:MAG: EscU/YscU/HrcU family type III secretion system export apparatus switch protein [Deltaproteobacteria bacterium]|nr:EscU/YscU/HrcU family type III secretion system export apparatus switch protein [Deltaproteobacteria bacterium]
MSDGGTGEKTEEASPQKLKQARDKGQVSKSQDAIQAMGFVLVFATTSLTLTSTAKKLKDFLYAALESAVRRGDDLPTVLSVVNQALWATLSASMPALGAAFVAGLASNYMQVGFMFTTEPLKPDIKKINPVDGFKNLFSKKKIVESIKNVLKFTIVSYVAYATLRDSMSEVVLSARVDLWHGVAIGGQIMYDIAIRVAALFIIISVADFFFQRWQYNKEMMMSKYDVKQEYKQSEGDPHQKAERKALAEELILHGSQQNVANADAVVVNPAHIAVAIKYDKEKGGAPKVVAKGMRKHAEAIKDIARENGVPILRNVPLAQALHKLDLEEEIPEELYEAVAEVLNFVFELRERESKAAEARRKAKSPKTNENQVSVKSPAAKPGNPAR